MSSDEGVPHHRINTSPTNVKNQQMEQTKNATTFSLLKQLPEDPSQMILSYLNLHNMLQLSLVSKHLRDMVSVSHTLFLPESQEAIQNDITVQSSFIRSIAPAVTDSENSFVIATHNPSFTNTLSDQQNYCQTHSSMTTLSQQSLDTPITIMSLEQISSLTSLQQFTSLLKRFQNLRHLTLYKLNLLEDKFLCLLKHYPSTTRLITLELHHVRILNNFDHIRSGKEETDIEIESSNPLLLNNLQHLSVSGTIFYAELAYLLISSSCKLNSIQFQGFRTLSDAYFTSLFTSSLHTSSSRFSSIAKGRENKFDMLEILQCKDFTQLHCPEISSTSIRCLDLSYGGTQSLSKINCPNLIELDLSFCSSLKDEGIESFLHDLLINTLEGNTNIGSLQILKLKGCTGLKSLHISSKSLKVLDLSLCTLLKSLHIDCLNLMEFQVGTCLNLTSLEVHLTPDLEVLDLSFLPRLHTLSLHNTPSLHSLNLSGCSGLTSEGIQLLDNEKLKYVNICGTGICVNGDTDQRRKSKNNVNDSENSCNWWGHGCCVVSEFQKPL